MEPAKRWRSCTCCGDWTISSLVHCCSQGEEVWQCGDYVPAAAGLLAPRQIDGKLGTSLAGRGAA